MFLESTKKFEERLRKALGREGQRRDDRGPDDDRPRRDASPRRRRMIARHKHNRLPVVEHGRLIGVVTRIDVLDALTADSEPGQARIDTGAIERNCARLAALGAAVRGGQGQRLRPRRGRGGAGGPARRRGVAGGGDRGRGGRAARRAASRGRLLVMGALSRRGAARRARRATPTSSPGARSSSRGCPADARVHVKLDTGMGRLGTRDPDEATRVARAPRARGSRAR